MTILSFTRLNSSMSMMATQWSLGMERLLDLGFHGQTAAEAVRASREHLLASSSLSYRS